MFLLEVNGVIVRTVRQFRQAFPQCGLVCRGKKINEDGPLSQLDVSATLKRAGIDFLQDDIFGDYQVVANAISPMVAGGALGRSPVIKKSINFCSSGTGHDQAAVAEQNKKVPEELGNEIL